MGDKEWLGLRVEGWGRFERRHYGSVRVVSAEVQGAEGMRGGLVRGENKGGEAAQERQGQHTSDSM